MLSDEAAVLESKAQASLSTQQFDEALSRYKQLCEMRPDYPDGWLMRGVVEGELGRLEEAVAAVNRAVELDGQYEEAFLTLAHLHRSRGDMDAALGAVNRALAIDADYGEALSFKGGLLGELQRYAEAVDSCSKAAQLLPDSAEVYANLGNAQQQLGRLSVAETAYRKAEELQSGRVEIQAALGNVLAGLGKSDEALELLQKLAEFEQQIPDIATGRGVARLAAGNPEQALVDFNRRLDLTPEYALGHVHAGIALRRLSRNDEAEESFVRALSSDDNSTLPLAHNLLGTLRIEDGKPEEALSCYEKALEIDPRYAVAIDNKGRALEALGRFEEALKEYRDLAELLPENADTAANQASILQRLGNNTEALQLIEPFVYPDKVTPRVAEVYSRLCSDENQCSEAAELIEGLLVAGIDDKDGRPLRFSLGKIYDQSGEHDKAFQQFKHANQLKSVDYDPVGFSAYIDNLISTFSKGVFDLLPRPSESSDKPVFIVGMPRSGTSLVEQILASHPAVYGAGELRNIFDLVDGMGTKLGGLPYPSCIPSLTQPVVNVLSEEYLGAISQQAPAGVKRITDKMPHNFLHLGLIKVLFPDARIIHCVRNPLDTCLSCFFQDFTGYHPYGYNLNNLGTHYRDYQRLMEHWRDVVNIPMLEVGYEDLIADQERVSREIIEFTGLDWDECCLRFHETERTTRTASFDQVRKPLYKASVDRWRRYDAYLDELKQSLGDLV